MLLVESITDTVFRAEFATYTESSNGDVAIETWRSPTAIVFITVLLAESITDTVSEPEFATYTESISGVWQSKLDYFQ